MIKSTDEIWILTLAFWCQSRGTCGIQALGSSCQRKIHSFGTSTTEDEGMQSTEVSLQVLAEGVYQGSQELIRSRNGTVWEMSWAGLLCEVQQRLWRVFSPIGQPRVVVTLTLHLNYTGVISSVQIPTPYPSARSGRHAICQPQALRDVGQDSNINLSESHSGHL